MTGSHPSVHGGASSLGSHLIILSLPLLCARADSDLLLLVPASDAAPGVASAVATDVGDDNDVPRCARSFAVAASKDKPGT